MTIDERLERLVERHEALTQTVEAHERDMADLRKSQARTENTLRRAIRLSVMEARNQRKRHQELEVLLRAFLERGGNGKH